MSTSGLRSWIVTIIIGWGVLVFGASQPWAYVPLLAGMVCYGVIASSSTLRRGHVNHALVLSMSGVAAAIFLQMVPLPVSVLQRVSPVMPTASEPRPLSVDPASTALGLMFIIALSIFLVGLVNTMGNRDARRLTIHLIWLGVLVALIGILESSTSWRGLYWTAGMPLPADSTPHGPFSSRNHYATWMLMALTPAMGYLCAILEQRYRATRMKTLFILSAAIAMAVAVVQTQSRAGILGLVFAIVTMGALLMYRGKDVRRRLLVASPLCLLLIAGVMATGGQSIVRRFDVDSWPTAHGRLPIWRQATAIARDFPVTGSGFNTYQKVVAFYPSKDLDQPYEGAHNDFLQLAAEGGFLVGLPSLALLIILMVETRRRFHESRDDGVTEWLRIGASVGLAVVALQASVDFSLQIPANAAMCAVLAAIAVHRVPLERTDSRVIEWEK